MLPWLSKAGEQIVTYNKCKVLHYPQEVILVELKPRIEAAVPVDVHKTFLSRLYLK